ncbi:MAG: hypothetical protein QM758_01375 [Armatimonas sp.]
MISLIGLYIYWIKSNTDPFRYQTYNAEATRILQQGTTAGNIETTSASELSCDGKAYLLRYGKDGKALFFPSYIDYSGWACGYLFDKREYKDVNNGDTINVNLNARDKSQSFTLNLIKKKGENWYYVETFS